MAGQKNKLQTYRKFKLAFKFENYLSTMKNIDMRTHLIKFRTSSHKLLIETGRTNKGYIAVADRKFQVCNAGDIEDEEHFLVECSGYSNLRNYLIKSMVEVFPDIKNLKKSELFIWIMASRNSIIYNNLAYFIQKATSIRRNNIIHPDTSN